MQGGPGPLASPACALGRGLRPPAGRALKPSAPRALGALACVQPNGLHIRRHLLGQRAEGRGGQAGGSLGSRDSAGHSGAAGLGRGLPPSCTPAGTPALLINILSLLTEQSPGRCLGLGAHRAPLPARAEGSGWCGVGGSGPREPAHSCATVTSVPLSAANAPSASLCWVLGAGCCARPCPTDRSHLPLHLSRTPALCPLAQSRPSSGPAPLPPPPGSIPVSPLPTV